MDNTQHTHAIERQNHYSELSILPTRLETAHLLTFLPKWRNAGFSPMWRVDATVRLLRLLKQYPIERVWQDLQLVPSDPGGSESKGRK